MSRVPCHQRQVAHFLSVRLTFCIVTLPSFPQPFLRLRRAGKEKRAFDALRLRHRQAPWEEGKPKARKGAFPRALLPVFELGGFQTEERLELIIQLNLAIQLQSLYHKLQIARPAALSACQNGRPFILLFPHCRPNLTATSSLRLGNYRVRGLCELLQLSKPQKWP